MSHYYSVRIEQDNRFRFWVSLFVFIICALLSIQSESKQLLWVTLLFLAYNVTFSLSYLWTRREKASAVLHYGLLTIDSLSITASIALSGGIDSPLYILYLVLFSFCIYHESLSSFVFAVVISFLFYPAYLLTSAPITQKYIYAVMGELLLMGLLTGVLKIVLLRLVSQRKANERMVARSRTLAQISDLLSGSIANSKDLVKSVSKMIEEDVGQDGLKCRIVIHKSDQPFLPPSGGKVGYQIPVVTGDHVLGTLMVSRETNKPLTSSEQDFFSSIAQSLGVALHRGKLWDDVQTQLKQIEANMLLNAKDTSESFESYVNTGKDYHTLDDMNNLVEMEKGKWKFNPESCAFQDILKAVLEEVEQSAWGSKIDFQVIGPLNSLPLIHGDKEKIQKLLINMIECVLQPESDDNRIAVNLNYGSNELIVSIGNRILKSGTGNREDDGVRLMVCKKIVEAHHGRFWVHGRDHESTGILSFALPLAEVSDKPLESVEGGLGSQVEPN